MRSAITIFLLIQRCRLVEAYRYLEHIRKVHKKIFRVLWKKVPAQNTRFCQNISTFPIRNEEVRLCPVRNEKVNELLEIKCVKFPLNYHKSCLPPTYRIAQNHIQSCPQCNFSWAWKSIYWYIEIPHTLLIQGSHQGNMEKVMIESPQTPKLRQVCGSIVSFYNIIKWYHKEFDFVILICG